MNVMTDTSAVIAAPVPFSRDRGAPMRGDPFFLLVSVVAALLLAGLFLASRAPV